MEMKREIIYVTDIASGVKFGYLCEHQGWYCDPLRHDL